MQIAVSFRQLEASEPLREYASEKLEHVVSKYLQIPADAQVILSTERYLHIAKFNITAHGLTIKSEEKSEDMYSSIDLALDKLERQLRRYKDKIRDRKPVSARTGGLPFSYQLITPTFEDPASVVEETPEGLDPEELDAAARGEYDDNDVPAPEDFGFIDVTVPDSGARRGHQHVKVLRHALGKAPTMTVAEAIMQLDLLNEENVLVFTRSETGSINVLHRRDDGNYNLIET